MSEPSVRIEYADRFKKDVKRLYKKYRRFQVDMTAFIDELMSGALPGDQVPGVGYPVYKARIRSTDAGRGKSGGFRVIYYLKTETSLVLLTTYAKSEQQDITAERIRYIIDEYESPRR